jgi:GPH family glycoside/pentoside/hexuronide:cation symporter
MIPIEGKVPTRLAVFHGMGSIAYGVKDNGFSTFLLLYYNQVLGMDAWLVSSALALALMLDAFIDPVIGQLSDRTYSRFGRRLPWLFLAALPLALAWVLLWIPLGEPSFLGLVLLAVLVRSLVSCCEVPSVALVPEITRDYDERARIMRYRFLFGWTGGLFLSVLAYGVIFEGNLLQADGYRAYGLAGAALILFSVLASAIGQAPTVAGYPAKRPDPLSFASAFNEIREALSHKAFLVLFAAGALAYTSQGVTFSISNYLYSFVWKFTPQAFQVYPWVLLASVIVTFFTLGPMIAKWGKRETGIVTALLGAVFWVTPFLLRASGLWFEEASTASFAALFVMFFFSNVFSVAAMISIYSMIADVVEASEEETGRRNEGTFYAGGIFMQKFATGMGIFLTGMVIEQAGLPAKAEPGSVAPEVIDMLSLSYIAIVSLFVVAIALVLRRFPITRADHEARVAKLKAAQVNPDGEGMHP